MSCKQSVVCSLVIPAIVLVSGGRITSAHMSVVSTEATRIRSVWRGQPKDGGGSCLENSLR